jgi:acyl carrier protein
MNDDDKSKLKIFLQSCLAERGDHAVLEDSDSLFSSGRLDSLTMTRVVVFLEQQYGVDFTNINFDIDLIDSIEAIESLISETATH